MNVVRVERRNTYITLDFSIEEIQHLKRIFDNASIVYNSEEDDKMPKADKWLTEEFYPVIDELVDKIRDS